MYRNQYKKILICKEGDVKTDRPNPRGLLGGEVCG
jgi:hypothetical protein